MKKVLILTYYWPPSGGAGVQRWLKFVKYLRAFGWEPVVYTALNPENPSEDSSLLKDVPNGVTVLKTKIFEPYGLYKRFVGRKPADKINAGFLSENKKAGITEKISVWIRGNYFIPDARKFWIRPSIKYLHHYLSAHQVDAIVSSGPPHSMHLIAKGLREKFNIPWIADFRDPWTRIDFYHDLMLSRASDKRHHELENAVLQKADAVISISPSMSEEFISIYKHYGGKDVKKFHVITNGYDEEDLWKGEIVRDKKFSLAHIGSLVKSRNHPALWQAIRELVQEDKSFAADLEIKLVGKNDYSVYESLERYGLTSFLNKIDYLNHEEVIKVQQESQVLLLLLNNTQNVKGILTGKLFEYLASGRPLLCIGDITGDAARIISETQAGEMRGFEDKDGIKKLLIGYYLEYKNGKTGGRSKETEKYSRKNLTASLSEILNNLKS